MSTYKETKINFDFNDYEVEVVEDVNIYYRMEQLVEQDYYRYIELINIKKTVIDFTYLEGNDDGKTDLVFGIFLYV